MEYLAGLINLIVTPEPTKEDVIKILRSITMEDINRAKEVIRNVAERLEKINKENYKQLNK